jgi:alpha-glucoside transport system permease protein
VSSQYTPPPSKGDEEEQPQLQGEPGPRPTGKKPSSVGTRSGLAAFRVASAFAIPIISLVAIYLTFIWLRDTEANKIIVVAVAVIVGVGGVFALYYGMDRLVNLLPEEHQESVRPWVFVGPALVVLGVFLVYPAINTIILSFQDANGETFVGLDNFAFVFTEPDMLRSIRNTAGWIIIVPLVSVSVGLAVAVLADRLRRAESIAKSLIFLPMAVSFVGASVVWGLIYDFQLFGNQTGLLNGIWTALGNDPTNWLAIEPWNNLFLMVVMIWMQTGFAMVILSAAIKSVPDDLLEASRIDGASEIQIFWKIIIPTIMSSIVVVTTTMLINVLKIFDIVWVMTNGESGTEIIAERMIRYFFRFGDDGKGAAVAVVLFLAIIPVMLINVRRFRAEEEIR